MSDSLGARVWRATFTAAAALFCGGVVVGVIGALAIDGPAACVP